MTAQIETICPLNKPVRQNNSIIPGENIIFQCCRWGGSKVGDVKRKLLVQAWTNFGVLTMKTAS